MGKKGVTVTEYITRCSHKEGMCVCVWDNIDQQQSIMRIMKCAALLRLLSAGVHNITAAIIRLPCQ